MRTIQILALALTLFGVGSILTGPEASAGPQVYCVTYANGTVVCR